MVTMGNCPKAQKKEKGEIAPVPVRCIPGVICKVAVWLKGKNGCLQVLLLLREKWKL